MKTTLVAGGEPRMVNSKLRGPLAKGIRLSFILGLVGHPAGSKSL